MLVGLGYFQFAPAKAVNQLLFQLPFNKHLQVMFLKWFDLTQKIQINVVYIFLIQKFDSFNKF